MSYPIYLANPQLPLFTLTNPDIPDLIAVGGALSVDNLKSAYSQGLFPWFNEDQPPLWWCPQIRAILPMASIHCSRRLKRFLRQKPFSFSVNQAFDQVMHHCANRPETWLHPAMQRVYQQLFAQGYGFSVEVWQQQRLVGGVYGVKIGRMLYGESMFSKVSNASKAALLALGQVAQPLGYPWLDCQMPTEHLQRLGAINISRDDFLAINQQGTSQPVTDPWPKNVVLF